MASNASMTHLPDWRALLEAEVARNPRGKAGVAPRLGIKRSYLSRIMSSGSSAVAASPEVIRRVIDRFHLVDECPATNQPMPRSDCLKALQAAPTHNPLSMRIWRCCQTCPHKPDPVKE